MSRIPAASMLATVATATALVIPAGLATAAPQAGPTVTAAFQTAGEGAPADDSLRWQVTTPHITGAMAGQTVTTTISTAATIDCTSLAGGYAVGKRQVDLRPSVLSCTSTNATLAFTVPRGLTGHVATLSGWAVTDADSESVDALVAIGQQMTGASVTTTRPGRSSAKPQPSKKPKGPKTPTPSVTPTSSPSTTAAPSETPTPSATPTPSTTPTSSTTPAPPETPAPSSSVTPSATPTQSTTAIPSTTPTPSTPSTPPAGGQVLGTWNGQQVSLVSDGGNNTVWVGSTSTAAPGGTVAHVSLDGGVVNLWIQNAQSMDQWKLDLATRQVTTQSIPMDSLEQITAAGFMVHTVVTIRATYDVYQVFSWAGVSLWGPTTSKPLGLNDVGVVSTVSTTPSYNPVDGYYLQLTGADGTVLAWDRYRSLFQPEADQPELLSTTVDATGVDYRLRHLDGTIENCRLSAAGRTCDAPRQAGERLGDWQGQQVRLMGGESGRQVTVGGATVATAPSGLLVHASLDGQVVNLWTQGSSTLHQWTYDLGTGQTTTQEVAYDGWYTWGRPGFVADTQGDMSHRVFVDWNGHVVQQLGDVVFYGFTDSAVAVGRFGAADSIEVYDVDGSTWGKDSRTGIYPVQETFAADAVNYAWSSADGPQPSERCTITKAAGVSCTSV